MLPALLLALAAHVQHAFTGFNDEPRQVAFSPGSRVLATSCVDGLVKLWRVSDHALVRVLRHPAGVTSVQFSADGRQIVAGSYDGNLRLWRDGALAATPKPAAASKTIRIWRSNDGSYSARADRP